jgi:hypothetical protein
METIALINNSTSAVFFPKGGVGKKVIYGYNSSKRGGRLCPISTHAEMDALIKLYGYIKKYNIRKIPELCLLVVRYTSTGKLASSRPCFHCLNSLEKSGLKIKYIYYSNKEGSIDCEEFINMKDNENTQISSGWREYTNMPKTVKELKKSKI